MGRFADKRRAVLTAALRPARQMCICDVGANPLGDPPYKGLVTDGLAHLYGFEPNPEAFARLQAEKTGNETFFCEAVGLPGRRILHLHPKSGFTSLYPLDERALRAIGKEKWAGPGIETLPVSPVTLDILPELPPVDLLKMDLQGGELEVLRGAVAKLSTAVAVVTEVRFHRIYEGEALFGDLDRELRRQGFKLHKFLFTKSVMMPHAHEDKVVRKRMTSQLLDGDAVYLRDGDIAGWDDDALIHLAFLADTVFDSPDLVLGCIDQLAGRGKADAGLADRYIARLRTHQRAAPRQAAG